MIQISISRAEVERAVKETEEFDAQKTYNKFEFKDNWIGKLGENLVEQYFKDKGITADWVEFCKQGIETPDFYMQGKSFDLKTSFGTSLLVGDPKFDTYMFCRLNRDNPCTLFLIGVVSKATILRWYEDGKISQVKYGERKVYDIPCGMLSPIEDWLAKYKLKP